LADQLAPQRLPTMIVLQQAANCKGILK